MDTSAGAAAEPAPAETRQVCLLVAVWLALSVAAVLPVFIVEYAPLYDYYSWVYQGRIVADLLHAGPDAYASAHRYYSLSRTPVPNTAAPLAIGVLTMMTPPGASFLRSASCSSLYGYAYLSALVVEVAGRPRELGPKMKR